MADRIATTAHNAIEPTPTTGTIFLGRRFPKTASTTKLATGNAGINHNRWSTLSSHLTYGISIQRFEPAIDLKDQGQPYRDLSGGHRKNK